MQRQGQNTEEMRAKNSARILSCRVREPEMVRYTEMTRTRPCFSEPAGEYYLSDLGSKNGTSVDGHMAVGNEEIRLTDGAGVKFADLEYVFRRSGGSRR